MVQPILFWNPDFLSRFLSLIFSADVEMASSSFPSPWLASPEKTSPRYFEKKKSVNNESPFNKKRCTKLNIKRYPKKLFVFFVGKIPTRKMSFPEGSCLPPTPKRQYIPFTVGCDLHHPAAMGFSFCLPSSKVVDFS